MALPGLLANTDYYWILTDKFDHVYSEVVTTDGDGAFVISADDFPGAFFNEHAGQMTLEVKGNPYYCESLGFTICGVYYDMLVIDFKSGHLPAKIPCECLI